MPDRGSLVTIHLFQPPTPNTTQPNTTQQRPQGHPAKSKFQQFKFPAVGFGAEFIPIYQRHPNTEITALCQRNEESLNKVADEYGITKRYTGYDALLADPISR